MEWVLDTGANLSPGVCQQKTVIYPLVPAFVLRQAVERGNE